jgi:hypothetical protein
MSLYVVFHNLIGLLIDALPWFLGGAILGAALETYLPTAWATRWLGSPRASILHATFAGAILPGCSMTTVPLAAALKTRGARLGTLTAVHHDFTDSESRDNHPYRGALRCKVHHRPDRLPGGRDRSHGFGLECPASTANQTIPTACR